MILSDCLYFDLSEVRGNQIVIIRPGVAAGNEVTGPVRAVEQRDEMQRSEKVSSRSHKCDLYILSVSYSLCHVSFVRLPREDLTVDLRKTARERVTFTMTRSPSAGFSNLQFGTVYVRQPV